MTDHWARRSHSAHPEPRRSVAEARVEGLARIANRIVNEFQVVNRVVGACPECSPQADNRRDITSKPPGTIEWE